MAALAALCLVPLAHGQNPAPAGGAPPAVDAGRVGILNFRQAIVNTAEGKQAAAELQSQFAPRQTELENIRKQIEDAQKRLRDGERTLSDEEKGRIQRQIDAWTRRGQRVGDAFQEDLNTAQDEVFQRIGGKMIEVVDRYARENGYSLVLDVSAQTSPVIFASQTVNITQEIIRLYDQANPVKAAAPQPPPARPQPGQTRPPTPPPATKPPQQ
jgi:outer membrane protein